MKTKIFSIVSAVSVALVFQGCHDPKMLESTGDSRGILSMNAKFINDENSENSFDADIDYDNHTIDIRFPMYYPKASFNELPADAIKNVRLTASLSNNSVIEPALTTLDLTKVNYITVKNPQGVKTQYTVTGHIVELWECSLLEIELENGTAGIIDETNHVITLIATDVLEPQRAIVKISPHATVSPDIVNEPFDFESENATITVVAQNGVDKTEYSIVKGEPDRVPFGLREGSESLRWVKRWDEVGYTMKDVQTGIGVTEKYLVLNEVGNMQAVVINASDGTDSGKRLDMGIIPNGMNHNMTSDHAGHIIVNSKYSASSSPTFKLWVFDGVDDKGKLLIDQNVYGAGDRVSVYGDVTKDAVIITPLNGTSLQACRWFIKDGVLGSAQVINLAGVASTPWGNVDFAPTSATDINAELYAVFYALVNNTRGPVMYNGDFSVRTIGKPNTKKRSDGDGGLADAGNWIMNACDYREFNKSKYFAHNSVNTFTWGANDFIYLIDVTSGNFDDELFRTSDTHGAINMLNNGTDGKYGAMAAGNVGVGSNGNDVRLWVSESGFYMYTYFMFTNGYIGCIRVDCIQY